MLRFVRGFRRIRARESTARPAVGVGILAAYLTLTVGAVAQNRPALTTVQVAKLANPSTVTIVTLGSASDTLAVGSGFVVDAQGIVVTNWHVLEGARKAVIELPGGERFEAVRFLAGDSLADLALLKFPGFDLPALTTRTSIPEPGEKVVVIGSPLGLSETVSEGIVSAVRVLDGRQLVQMSAPISPGSSGGPVLDDRGRVFAVATSYLRKGQQLNFAVPIRYALGLLTEQNTPQALELVFGGPRSNRAHPSTPPASLDPVIRALDSAKALIDSKRPRDAIPFLSLALERADPVARENVAALAYHAAAPLLQEDSRDYPAAAELLRLAIKAATPGGKVAPAANYLLGLATLLQVPDIDPKAEKPEIVRTGNSGIGAIGGG